MLAKCVITVHFITMIGHCEVLNYIIEHSITFAGESTHNEREKEM